jgi:hypothetical protein
MPNSGSMDVAFNLSDSKVERRWDFTLYKAENDRSAVQFVTNVIYIILLS